MAKTKMSVKQSTPIPLPHDGPVHANYRRICQSKQSSKTDGDLDADAVRDAAHLLHSGTIRSPTDRATLPMAFSLSDTMSKGLTENDARVVRLFMTLRGANKIQNQLLELHSFKSWCLQSSQSSKSTDNFEQNSRLFSALYRILLEWMSGAQTPVTLRRALQSILQILLVRHSIAQSRGISLSVAVSIQRSMFETLLVPENSTWSKPLHSLQEALMWEPLQSALDGLLIRKTVTYLAVVADRIKPLLQSSQSVEDAVVAVWDKVFLEHLERALELALLIKTVLRLVGSSLEPDERPDEWSLKRLQDILWVVLTCRAVPVDSLPTVCIAYGRVVFLLQCHACGDEAHRTNEARLEDACLASPSALSDLQRASLLQGLAVTVSIHRLVLNLALLPFFFESFEQLALKSPDPDVRLSALKGIRALVSRCQSLGTSDMPQMDLDLLSDVALRTLEIVMTSWEKPPTRKLANELSCLFQSLVHWMWQLRQDERSTGLQHDQAGAFTTLMVRLLAQPLNRKGRYLALESMLPIIGAQAMLEESEGLLNDLLSGIADHGHNTKIIAELWAKLLETLLMEQLEPDPPKSLQATVTAKGRRLPAAWLQIWVPSLARALVTKEFTRRKQLSAFCLPRIATVVDAVAGRAAAGQLYSAMLEELQCISGPELYSQERETSVDRILWAKLEIVRTTGRFRYDHVAARELRPAVAASVPLQSLCAALIHPLSSIRVAALQSMNQLVESYHGDTVDSELVTAKQEILLWKYMLPFAVKTEGKEYLSVVLECLVSFLDRLLLLVEAQFVCSREDVCSGSIEALLNSFISEFLLKDMLRFLGYPGTTADKESFLLSMLEHICPFAARDCSCVNRKLLSEGGMVDATKNEGQTAKAQVRSSLLSPEVFASLFSVLHSIWDVPREIAYKLFLSLLELAHQETVPHLMSNVAPGDSRPSLLERGLMLASSPQPREADTGSRILALLCHALPSTSDKLLYVAQIIGLLGDRLESMKTYLTTIETDETGLSECSALPLAHGLAHSLQLVVENDSMFLGELDALTSSLLTRMIEVFIRALQLALVVVADMREGEDVEGMEFDLALSECQKSITTKVNRGALGANGIFSSVKRVSEDEARVRMVSQRIVVGTWLLTKETCAAIASTIATKGYRIDASLVDRTGMLLISTLTSLKHTGAAFAAHHAIQSIAQLCLDKSKSELQHLPARWMGRLLAEVSQVDKVLHSTLRRSTGYALGFTSIMRADVSSRAAPRSFCFHVLLRIVTLSLPPKRQLQSFLSTIGYDTNMEGLFSHIGTGPSMDVVADASYEIRSRIHALNILRLIILDAPLSKEVFPFIGDALSSAIIGYTDPAFAIRNSSTMVFAAFMLRSVDPDKNAKNSDSTSRRAAGAIDLFRSYPALPNFLLSVMRESLDGRIAGNSLMSLPPVLPILLLLARIESVAQSGSDAASLTEPFVKYALRCLGSRELIVRKTAARALANLASREQGAVSSFERLAEEYHLRLSALVQNTEERLQIDWNKCHGALLAIHELLKSSNDGRAAVQTTSGHIATDVVWIEGGAPALPPTCMLTLLEICAEIEEGTDVLLERCCGIVSWLEGPDRRKLNVAGWGELGGRAAEIATHSICSRLWNVGVPKGDIPSLLSLLKLLLKSPCLDARVAAVKGFKKGIYCGLDLAVDRYIQQQTVVGDLLIEVTALVADVLSCELERYQGSDTSTRSHPPTLRRLSRCLLECLNAAGRVGMTTQMVVSIRRNLEGFAALFFDDGACKEVCDKYDSDSRPLLLGNLAELSSLVVAADESIGLKNRTAFVSFISRLSDPSCHWRLRHSAASALGNICRSEQKCQADTIATWIRLIQDSDMDVRCAASTSWTSCPVPPEMILSSLFQKNGLASSKLLNFVFEKVLEISSGLEQAGAAAAPIEISKKIFKEEDPNAYSEEPLSLQFAIVAALEGPHAELSEYVRSLSNEIVGRCKDVLAALVDSASCDDSGSVLLNIYRTSGVFVAFHSLLVGCSSILFLVDHIDSCTLRELAASSLRIQLSRAHPCIVEALSTLSTADFRSEATKQAILNCCFLTDLLMTGDPMFVISSIRDCEVIEDRGVEPE
jgi:hypothetical protein